MIKHSYVFVKTVSEKFYEIFFEIYFLLFDTISLVYLLIFVSDYDTRTVYHSLFKKFYLLSYMTYLP